MNKDQSIFKDGLSHFLGLNIGRNVVHYDVVRLGVCPMGPQLAYPKLTTMEIQWVCISQGILMFSNDDHLSFCVIP